MKRVVVVSGVLAVVGALAPWNGSADDGESVPLVVIAGDAVRLVLLAR